MNKVKRLFISLFTLTIVSNTTFLAMDCNIISKNISQNLSLFYAENLFSKACESLNFSTKLSELSIEQKSKIMDKAVEFINDYKPKKDIKEIAPIKDKHVNYNDVINSHISNFESTGTKNCVSTAFILYRLAEYMNLPAVVKLFHYRNKSVMCTVWQDRTLIFEHMNPYDLPYWFNSMFDSVNPRSHYNPINNDVSNKWRTARSGYYLIATVYDEYILLLPPSNSNVNWEDLAAIKYKHTRNGGEMIMYPSLDTIYHSICKPIRTTGTKPDFEFKLQVNDNSHSGLYVDNIEGIFDIENI